jgi:hypothetical protein
MMSDVNAGVRSTSLPASAPVVGVSRAFSSFVFTYRMRSTTGLKSRPVATSPAPASATPVPPMSVATPVPGSIRYVFRTELAAELVVAVTPYRSPSAGRTSIPLTVSLAPRPLIATVVVVCGVVVSNVVRAFPGNSATAGSALAGEGTAAASARPSARTSASLHLRFDLS